MLDKRLPDDILFLVMEEDFRWWPDHDDPDSADEYDLLAATVAQTAKARKVRPPSARGSKPPTGDEPTAFSQGGKAPPAKKATSEWHAGSYRGSLSASRGEDWGLKQEVADTIRICTFAHRKGMGDFMNLCWVGDGKKGWVPHHGAMFMALSKRGAQKVAAAMDSLHAGHIDIVWKNWLKQGPEVQADVGFSYLYPPMGNYTQHISECDPHTYGEHTQGRPADWGKPFCCQGTRREDDPQNREKWLCQLGMTKAGNAVSWKVALPTTERLHGGE